MERTLENFIYTKIKRRSKNELVDFTIVFITDGGSYKKEEYKGVMKGRYDRAIERLHDYVKYNREQTEDCRKISLSDARMIINGIIYD